MSAADGSTPQVLDPFEDELDTLVQVRVCNLWPPEADFSKLCSCDECRPKIETLKVFEKEIKARSRLVSDYGLQLNNKEIICLSIYASAWWTKRMLNFFHKKLKAVSEDLGVQWTFDSAAAAKLEIDEKIAQMLRNIGLISKADEAGPVVPRDNDDNYVSSEEIDAGLYHYRLSKSKDVAHDIIHEIEKLDNEAQNSLDPTLSMKYIKKQIELVKRLPVEELHNEVVELIEQIHPRDSPQETIQKARECISGICWPIISKRKEFWRKYAATDNNDHCSNGLKETLDSLMEMVNFFEELWKKDFAHFFTRYDRSDSKRQRVD